jgi:uncharacterized protein YlxP (DUF503 family)
VSIAEVEDNDLWQSAVLGGGVGEQRQAVGSVPTRSGCPAGLEATRGHLGATLAPRFANQVLSKVVDFIESSPDLVVDDYQLGFC